MLGVNIVTSVFSLADRTLEKAFVDSGKLDLGLVSATGQSLYRQGAFVHYVSFRLLSIPSEILLFIGPRKK